VLKSDKRCGQVAAATGSAMVEWTFDVRVGKRSFDGLKLFLRERVTIADE